MEFDLRAMARHLVDTLERDREIITFDETELAFQEVMYGEPGVILQYPLLSVMPIRKSRALKTTRKYDIVFEIHLIIYHTKITEFGEIQEGAHKRAEAVEVYINSDRKWNFTNDIANQKVIHGFVSFIDHPTIFLGEGNLWAASRLGLEAMSEEVF